jgi:hypothetical protein
MLGYPYGIWSLLLSGTPGARPWNVFDNKTYNTKKVYSHYHRVQLSNRYILNCRLKASYDRWTVDVVQFSGRWYRFEFPCNVSMNWISDLDRKFIQRSWLRGASNAFVKTPRRKSNDGGSHKRVGRLRDEGARGSIVVKALCYKPEGHGFDTRWGDFLNLSNLSGRTRPWGLLSL